MLADSIPAFDAAVPDGGYRWWYVDAVSDCGNYGLVIIVFIGSVFSPYYYRSRQKHRGDPRQHSAINIASYGPGINAWSMTERGSRQLTVSPDEFGIARSRVAKDGDQLSIAIDERTAPWFMPLKGMARVEAHSANAQAFFLDAGQHHQWQPIAPIARISVALERPAIRWTGDAYVDTNAGTRPLENDFHSWHWSSVRSAGHSRIYYDVIERDNERHCLALSVDAENRLQRIDAPTANPLPRSGWGIVRESRHGKDTSVIQTLEDAPFYARSLLSVTDAGEPAVAMHESLSMQRFVKPWVRTLLPFRMPRVTF